MRVQPRVSAATRCRSRSARSARPTFRRENQAFIVVVRRRARCGVERRREQPMRLEPAFLRPRRSRPTVKRQTGTGEQFVDRHLLENDVGAVGSKLPPRPNDCRRKPALGAELLRRRRCGCATNWFPCRFDTIQVVQVIGVIGRHRIGMEDEIGPAFSSRSAAMTAARGGAAGLGGRVARGGRLEGQDQKRSQRLHRLHVLGYWPGEVGAAPT